MQRCEWTEHGVSCQFAADYGERFCPLHALRNLMLADGLLKWIVRTEKLASGKIRHRYARACRFDARRPFYPAREQPK